MTDKPHYQAIYQHFRDLILSGKLSAGTRLPSSRALAKEYGYSRTTLIRAFDQLLCEGYVETITGSGTFVRDVHIHPTAKVQQNNPTVSDYRNSMGRNKRQILDTIQQLEPNQPTSVDFDFRHGQARLDNTALRQWQNLIRQQSGHFQQIDINYAGNPYLRHAIAQHLSIYRGLDCSVEQIIITSGSQQALNLVSRLLSDEKHSIICESPCYLGATTAFMYTGSQINYCPVDAQGIDITNAPDNGRLIYTTPSHQYPTGVVMSIARRQQLITWAMRHQAMIIEDDYDSEYRYRGLLIPSIFQMDNHQNTLYIGTFSKTLFPALRIGYIVAPQRCINDLIASKWSEDRASSTFQQQVLTQFISQGFYARHLKRMRNRYAELQKTLSEALNNVLGARQYHHLSNAGLHILVDIPEIKAEAAQRFITHTAQQSIRITCANPLYHQPCKSLKLILGFTQFTLDQIQSAVVQLKHALDSFQNTPTSH